MGLALGAGAALGGRLMQLSRDGRVLGWVSSGERKEGLKWRCEGLGLGRGGTGSHLDLTSHPRPLQRAGAGAQPDAGGARRRGRGADCGAPRVPHCGHHEPGCAGAGGQPGVAARKKASTSYAARLLAWRRQHGPPGSSRRRRHASRCPSLLAATCPSISSNWYQSRLPRPRAAGGDYGKKELSPALSNRFTSIWVPAIEDLGELGAILESRLAGAAAGGGVAAGPAGEQCRG